MFRPVAEAAMVPSGIDKVLKVVMAASLAVAVLITISIAARSGSDPAAGFESLEHRLFGGARRGGVADDVDFARPVRQFLFEIADTLVSLRQDERVDAFEDDRLAARCMLHVDRVPVGAEEAGIGGYFDAQLVQPADRLVADVPGDGFAGHETVDTEPDLAPLAGELFGKPEPDPVRPPVGDDNRGSDIRASFEHLPGIHTVNAVAALQGRPMGACSRRNDDSITAGLVDDGAVELDTGAHLDARTPHLALEIWNNAAELGAAGEELGKACLAPEPRLGLEQNDVMTPLGQARGRFHPRRTGEPQPRSPGLRFPDGNPNESSG